MDLNAQDISGLCGELAELRAQHAQMERRLADLERIIVPLVAQLDSINRGIELMQSAPIVQLGIEDYMVQDEQRRGA